MILSFSLICLSTYLIWKASESFDIASSYLTRNLNEGIKGPTINAIASSLPELLISFFFLKTAYILFNIFAHNTSLTRQLCRSFLTSFAYIRRQLQSYSVIGTTI